jgi:hypothetical protein
VNLLRAVLAADLALTVSCAAFMAWNAGKSTMTVDCTGLDEVKCNPLKTSSSFCCDQHLGWSCNPAGKAADSPYPGQCEYTGDDRTDSPVWCGGPLGCVGAVPDGGRDGH